MLHYFIFASWKTKIDFLYFLQLYLFCFRIYFRDYFCFLGIVCHSSIFFNFNYKHGYFWHLFNLLLRQYHFKCLFVSLYLLLSLHLLLHLNKLFEFESFSLLFIPESSFFLTCQLLSS